MVRYTDLDFVGCLNSRKFTLGYVFMVAIGVVPWKIIKQWSMTSSTMHAEFMVAMRPTCEALWVQNFNLGLRVVNFFFSHLESSMRTF